MIDLPDVARALSIPAFADVHPELTVRETAAAWERRSAKRNFAGAFLGHLEPRGPEVSEHEYAFLGNPLKLRAFINTRVAKEWYSGPTLYCELMEFHRAGLTLVNPGDMIFDCGAHHAIYSMVFSEAAGPRGRVVAFEPVAINAEIARLNIDLNGYQKIEVIEAGIGAQKEVIRGSMQAHSTATNTSDMPDARDMQILTLDQFAHLSPDLVKIDIEGAEVDALDGARKLLEQRPRLLISVHPPLMAQFGRDPREIFSFIDSSGYDAYCLEGGRPVRPVDNNIDYSNFFELLFLPK